MAWSYIAQRAVTKEFLHWDIPIQRDELSWALSGAGSLKGTISPDVGHLRADDGRLLLEEWGTLLYAEEDGVIRWGGIVVSSGFEGDDWSVEAASFATYPHGIPYDGDFQRIGIDPVECAAEIWRHVQSYADGDLDVQITATPTPVRLGTPSIPGHTEVFLDGRWQKESDVDPARIAPSAESELSANMSTAQTFAVLSDLSEFKDLPLPFTASIGDEKVIVTSFASVVTAEDGSLVPASFYGQPNNPNALVALAGLTRGAEGTAATRHFAGTDVKRQGTKKRQSADTAAGPYSLVWWETTDCGQELDRLAQTTPFDYTEVHGWAGDDVIEHRVFIGYPRLGRRREDISFVQGDNVTSVVDAQSNGDDYANAVVGVGSGEGRTTLRREIARRDGRLRRTSVFSDKSVSDIARMDALIRDELERRRGLVEITSVDVVDHPNAPIGSWGLGDDVLVTADLPWLGEVSVWCRVIGWTLTGEHSARLSLARSDSFHYGG